MSATTAARHALQPHSRTVSGTRPAGRTNGWATEAERRRSTLTIALGMIWLLDAVLQFQPYLYTSAFPDGIRAAGLGSPAWVSGPDRWAAELIATNVPVWNTLFALTQLAIGLGLLTRRYRTAALAGSIAWAIMVWWLGEGLGATLAGPADALTGFPGAVLIYAIIAALLWPSPGQRRAGDRPPSRPAATGPALRSQRAAKIVWVLLWAGLALETLRPSERTGHLLHDELDNQATAEPGWLQHLDHLSAGVASTHHALVSIILVIAFTLAAALVALPFDRAVRVGAWFAASVGIVIWGLGQNFGGILTGHATDPNSGLLLAVFALCFVPVTTVRVDERPVTLP